MDLDKLEEKLQKLSDTIDEELFKEWKDHPVTKYWELAITQKALEKDLYLAGGAFIDSENGLSDAAKAIGAKIALLDILDIAFEDEAEMSDEG